MSIRSPRTRRRTPERMGAAPSTGRQHRRLGWLTGPTTRAACLGSLLVWCALPPLGWWPVAWFAPIPWLRLARRPALAGTRPYLGIWLAGFLFWVLTLHGIVLAHWANYFGITALSAYLALFFVLFMAITRTAIHQCRWPLWLAAPVVWTGIELARGYGPVGLSLAMLAHTQAHWPVMIQVADTAGGFALSFIIMFVASCLTELWPLRRRGTAAAVTAALAAVALTILYGAARLATPAASAANERPVRAALIQGSIDTMFDDDEERRVAEMWYQYRDLTLQACRQYSDLDLIVWPESMFPLPDIILESDSPELEPGMQLSEARKGVDAFRQAVSQLASVVNQENHGRKPPSTTLVLGTTTWRFGTHAPERFNSAVIVGPDGRIETRYFKTHPVIFGEYMPFGEIWPWLYRLTPMPNGLSAGPGPIEFEAGGLRWSPSICFESLMPHLIHAQIAQLADQGRPPDVLVNLTNDGWFWGSSILDLHLTSALFRAVENRIPVLIAANTGFSAWIDGNGRVVRQGPRRKTAALLAEVRPDSRDCLYRHVGQWPAGVCLAATVIAALCGLWRFRKKQGTGG